VATVLRWLSARDRDALARFYLAEESPEEICAALGLTETQFRLIRSKALARFAGTLTRGRQAVKTAATQPAQLAVIEIGRLVPVVAHAVAVFGDEQKASHWFVSPLPLLGNLSPMQALARRDGVETIDRILTRIEYNIPS
jgi:uncharacterized protein (DUF2384 family)